MSARKKSINSEQLRNRLKLRSLTSEIELRKKHPTADNFYSKIGLRPGQIRQHATKLLASGALAGGLLLGSFNGHPVKAEGEIIKQSVTSIDKKQKELAANLQKILQGVTDWQISSDQEKTISEDICKTYGVRAMAVLDGNRLNNSYGRMGAEQHLPRFPGDSIDQHEELQEKGITPGLGGWGYFAYSKEQMTPELYDTEKWYVAVQTLYLPNWSTDTDRLVKWYKYRRVLVVNPANGKAVVSAVADAGPAKFTGKHFGGSPEVMKYLEINYGMQNHPVVLFFLDDPEKKIPLGPLEYNVDKTVKENEGVI